MKRRYLLALLTILLLAGSAVFIYWKRTSTSSRQASLYIDNPGKEKFTLVADDDSVPIGPETFMLYPVEGETDRESIHHIVLRKANGKLISDTTLRFNGSVFINPSRSTYVHWHLMRDESDHNMIMKMHWLKIDTTRVCGWIDTTNNLFRFWDESHDNALGIPAFRPYATAEIDMLGIKPPTMMPYFLRKDDFLAAYPFSPILGPEYLLYADFIKSMNTYFADIRAQRPLTHSEELCLSDFRAISGPDEFLSKIIFCRGLVHNMQTGFILTRAAAPEAFDRVLKKWEKVKDLPEHHLFVDKQSMPDYSAMTQITYSTVKGGFLGMQEKIKIIRVAVYDAATHEFNEQSLEN